MQADEHTAVVAINPLLSVVGHTRHARYVVDYADS